jgi:hypothetical protein
MTSRRSHLRWSRRRTAVATRARNDVSTTADPRHNSDVMTTSYSASSRALIRTAEVATSTRTSMSSTGGATSLPELDGVAAETRDTWRRVEESYTYPVRLASAALSRQTAQLMSSCKHLLQDLFITRANLLIINLIICARFVCRWTRDKVCVYTYLLRKSI